MPEQPTLVDRDELAYLSLPAVTPMDGLSGVIDSGLGRLFAWLGAHQVAPAGPPLIRYNRIDMARQLDIELGIPVPPGTVGDDELHVTSLPAGRYLSLIHRGSYDGLIGANAALQAWATEHGVAFATRPSPDGDEWAARVEHYLTNPAEEPDTSRWQTEVAYLTV